MDTYVDTQKTSGKKGKGNALETKGKSGAPCMIRTCGPRFRNSINVNRASTNIIKELSAIPYNSRDCRNSVLSDCSHIFVPLSSILSQFCHSHIMNSAGGRSPLYLHEIYKLGSAIVIFSFIFIEEVLLRSRTWQSIIY